LLQTRVPPRAPRSPYTTLFRSHGEGGVRAHGAHRVLSLARHRGEQQAQGLLGVAEHALPGEQGSALLLRGDRRGVDLVEGDLVVAHPLSVSALTADPLLDFLVLDDAAFLEIDEEHLAGLEAPVALEIGRA